MKPVLEYVSKLATAVCVRELEQRGFVERCGNRKGEIVFRAIDRRAEKGRLQEKDMADESCDCDVCCGLTEVAPIAPELQAMGAAYMEPPGYRGGSPKLAGRRVEEGERIELLLRDGRWVRGEYVRSEYPCVLLVIDVGTSDTPVCAGIQASYESLFRWLLV